MNQSELDAKLIEEYPLFFLEMTPPQEAFIRCRNSEGNLPRTRLFEAGNKIGKCLLFQTLIDTPSGKVSVGSLFENGKPFDVYAWDGEKKVVAKASPPFKKEGLHKCYRIEMSDGSVIEAADYHRILTNEGWVFVIDMVDNPDKRPLSNHEVKSIERIYDSPVYDFEVEKYHNYFAGGMIHHNTHLGIAEDLAHAWGFRPWLQKDDPDYKVPIKVPNQGLVACETMMHSVPEKLDPVFRELIPKICKPKFKPGPTGVTIRITLPYDAWGKKCGSVIHIRSYDQRAGSFEGIDYDWIHWDEPPTEEIYKAVERGKVVTNAPTWFTMTPLKEAWVYNLLSLKAATRL